MQRNISLPVTNLTDFLELQSFDSIVSCDVDGDGTDELILFYPSCNRPIVVKKSARGEFDIDNRQILSIRALEAESGKDISDTLIILCVSGDLFHVALDVKEAEEEGRNKLVVKVKVLAHLSSNLFVNSNFCAAGRQRTSGEGFVLLASPMSLVVVGMTRESPGFIIRCSRQTSDVVASVDILDGRFVLVGHQNGLVVVLEIARVDDNDRTHVESSRQCVFQLRPLRCIRPPPLAANLTSVDNDKEGSFSGVAMVRAEGCHLVEHFIPCEDMRFSVAWSDGRICMFVVSSRNAALFLETNALVSNVNSEREEALLNEDDIVDDDDEMFELASVSGPHECYSEEYYWVAMQCVYTSHVFYQLQHVSCKSMEAIASSTSTDCSSTHSMVVAMTRDGILCFVSIEVKSSVARNESILMERKLPEMKEIYLRGGTWSPAETNEDMVFFLDTKLKCSKTTSLNFTCCYDASRSPSIVFLTSRGELYLLPQVLTQLRAVGYPSLSYHLLAVEDLRFLKSLLYCNEMNSAGLSKLTVLLCDAFGNHNVNDAVEERRLLGCLLGLPLELLEEFADSVRLGE